METFFESTSTVMHYVRARHLYSKKTRTEGGAAYKCTPP